MSYLMNDVINTNLSYMGMGQSPYGGMFPSYQSQYPYGLNIPQTSMVPSIPSGTIIPGTPSGVQGIPSVEESYIENILRFNRGKIATLYFSYEGSKEWTDRVYRGIIETAGRDHVIISDPQTGKRYILLMIYLDWVEFDGPINYIPPSIPSYIQQEMVSG